MYYVPYITCVFVSLFIYFVGFIVSVPKISPYLSPLMRFGGFMSTLPGLTDAAIKIVELRRKEESNVAVRERCT